MTDEAEMNRIHVSLARAAFVLFVLLCLDAAAHAQAVRPPTRVPVTVALVERLPDGGVFQIRRRADVAPLDVILLRADADAANLSEAIRTLLLARAQGGDTTRTPQTLRLRLEPGRHTMELPWALRVLTDLQRAGTREIPGVGVVRAVEIWLPPQRRSRPAR